MDELFNPDFVEVDRVLDVTQNEKEDGQVTAILLFSKHCPMTFS